MPQGKSPHFAPARDAHARFLAWALGLVTLLCPLAAFSAPPAGSAIDNTATATALEISSGIWLNPVSNTVRAMVQALDAATLTSAPAQTAPPGGSAGYAHVLINRGNATTAYRLTTSQLGGDDFDCASLALVHDVNRDGIAGPLESAIAEGASVTLAAGDSIALVLTAAVPLTAPGGSQANFTLSARAPSAVQETVTDVVHTPATGTPPAIAFWSNGFLARIRSSALGTPLYVQADAPQCDTRSSEIDSVTITLSSRLTGDADTFLAVETGPGTGVFRLAGTPVTVSPPVSAPQAFSTM